MFDLRVDIVDPSTGQVVRRQPYVRRVNAGDVRYERPPGSGWWYFENGKVAEEPTEEQKKAFEAKLVRDHAHFKLGDKVFANQAEMDQYVVDLEHRLSATAAPVAEPAPQAPQVEAKPEVAAPVAAKPAQPSKPAKASA